MAEVVEEEVDLMAVDMTSHDAMIVSVEESKRMDMEDQAREDVARVV